MAFSGRLRIDATNHTVVMNQFIKCISRQYTFGTVGNVHFTFQLRSFFIYNFCHTLGGKYRRCGFNNKQVSRLQVRNYGTGSRFHIGDVCPMVLFERGRHHYKESIRLLRV